MRKNPKTKQRLDQEKTLYVQLGHTIKNKDDVSKLFSGDLQIHLPRQRGRHCHVTFSDAETKMKNLKAVKGQLVDGKRIIVCPMRNSLEKKTRAVSKKIVIPEVVEDVHITRTLFIGNIKCGTKTQELKEALVGCGSVKLLKPHTQDFRSAIVKLNDVRVAGEYLSKEREWPSIQGRQLTIKPDTRKRHKKQKKSSATLKIYDGEECKEEKTKNEKQAADSSKDTEVVEKV